MKNLHILCNSDDPIVLNHAFHDKGATRTEVCKAFFETFDDELHEAIDQGVILVIWTVHCENEDSEIFREFAHQYALGSVVDPKALGATHFAAIGTSAQDTYRNDRLNAHFDEA